MDPTFNISTLIYCFDRSGRVLLMQRAKAPNLGLWSPPGGKLDRKHGESPHQCACREAREELGLVSTVTDYHLTGMISERAYENQSHWLMFLFEFNRPLESCPPPHEEGRFSFFSPEAIQDLEIPATDRDFIWPQFWKHRHGFFAAECQCHPDGSHDWNLLQSQIKTT